MLDVLIKAFSFLLIIMIGYGLKRKGVLQLSDSVALSKIMMNLTLPAAVITGFASFQVDFSLLILVVMGLGCNLLLLLAGYWMGRRKENGVKAFYMINTPGYNIGCFTLPYVQSFLGPAGIIAALLGFHLPSQVTILTGIIGNANPFIAMLIIGCMLEINIDRTQLKHAYKVLLVRYGITAIFAALFYFATPLPLEIRQVVAVAVFAPVSSLSPVFTSRLSTLGSVSSFAGSLSVFISIIIITSLLTVMLT